MELLISIAIGALFGCGTYLLLRRNIVRVLLGIMVLSQAANLFIFKGAGMTRIHPPIIDSKAQSLSGPYADPLPQALVLTAIVIGFAVLAYAIALLLRVYHKTHSPDVQSYLHSEDSKAP